MTIPRRGDVLELETTIPIDGTTLEGTLTVPGSAAGIVAFAHGSGSSRFSPRNRYVARMLQQAGLGTLLVDLLTAEEEQYDRRTGTLRFDIPFLAGRLVAITDWLAAEPRTSRLRPGYFGASTGGGAALVAAAGRPETIGAVVSRGGRPDLAADALSVVRAPTLLIVGAADTEVLALNRAALLRLPTAARLELIPGAGHLFEEPGALETVAGLARDWFLRHLDPPQAIRRGSRSA